MAAIQASSQEGSTSKRRLKLSLVEKAFMSISTAALRLVCLIS
jgi:hypothetical protein